MARYVLTLNELARGRRVGASLGGKAVATKTPPKRCPQCGHRFVVPTTEQAAVLGRRAQEYSVYEGDYEAHERATLEWMTDDARSHLDRLAPGKATFQRVVGGGFDVILGRRLEDVGEVAFEATAGRELGRQALTLGRLRSEAEGEELPLLVLEPRDQPGRLRYSFYTNGR